MFKNGIPFSSLAVVMTNPKNDTSFFQIFVLTDSKELSLEIGIHPEFAKEKTDEMKRYVSQIDLGLSLFIPSRHVYLSKIRFSF